MSARAILAGGRRLGGDVAGTVSVEFAVLLPVLLTLFFGCYETSNFLLADLKVNDAAQTVADLVAQTQTGYTLEQNTSSNPPQTDFTNFTSVVTAVMAPLPTTQLKVAYASIVYSTASPTIDWHYEYNGATAISIGSLPANLGINGSSTDSVIVVSVQYTYASPISYVLHSTYPLSNTAYDRPRYVSCIPGGTGTNSNSLCQ